MSEVIKDSDVESISDAKNNPSQDLKETECDDNLENTKSSTIQVLCELCNDDKVAGYGYCEDCDDPEILCLPCTRRHTASKKFKHHKISTNLVDLPSMTKREENETANDPRHDAISEQLEEVRGAFNVTESKSRTSLDDVETTLFNEQHPERTIYKLDTTSKEVYESGKYGDINQERLDMTKSTSELTNCTLSLNDSHNSKVSFDFENSSQAHQKSHVPNKHVITSAAFSMHKCGSCEYENKDKNATGFCLTCEEPEPLCDECSSQHLKQKLTRNHTLCYDLSKYKERRNFVMCEPCSFTNEEVNAETFCLNCAEPEPMCQTCAQQHLKQKMSRGHKLCHNIKVLHLMESVRKETKCIPCLYDNVDNIATSICFACEDPEPMCTNCGKSHEKQRQTRGHDVCFEIYKPSPISKDLKYELPSNHTNKEEEQTDLSLQHESPNFKNNIYCTSCMKNNHKIQAAGVCYSCNARTPFCSSCIEEHLQTNVFRNHKIDFDLTNVHRETPDTMTNRIQDVIENQTSKTKLCKPSVEKVASDSVQLRWDGYDRKADFYQVRYKATHEMSKEWTTFASTIRETCITVNRLRAKTSYIFQVRAVKDDQELPYSDNSDPVETRESLASRLREFSVPINECSPQKVQPPLHEDSKARNSKARTKQILVGMPKRHISNEKTIMLVGATGSGKSTLVDGIANYVFGVNFEDPFRFSLLQLEEEERKTENQAVSQTEWVTMYKIAAQQDGRLEYNLNVIDTPGFGDTRGIERDREIVTQIHNLFAEESAQNVLFLDCVCFIVKAPDARLTPSQKYVFNAIMSLFGKDIQNNICTLITFADGAKPPVLASLKESNLTFGPHFLFNNSALFEENEVHSSSLTAMFWEMGFKSFESFFAKMQRFQTQSLSQTKIVLDKREELKTIIEHLEPQMNAGLSTLSELKTQLEIFEKHKSDIENNQNFTYTVNETVQVKDNLPRGRHVTNCLQCNITCHADCRVVDDDKKKRCSAMDKETGRCKVCIGNCIWSDHKNAKYIFRYETRTVTKTYDGMKEKFEKASKDKVTHEEYLQKLNENIEDLSEYIKSQVEQMRLCKEELKEIALCPDPLTSLEHIDLLIEAQKIEKASGYQERIKMLSNFRQTVLLDSRVESFETSLNETQTAVREKTGRDYRKRKPKKNVVERSWQYVKKLF